MPLNLLVGYLIISFSIRRAAMLSSGNHICKESELYFFIRTTL